jgi:hypothetical protein
MAEWKQKLLDRRVAEKQAEIDKIRAIEAAKEARWIGVPAWFVSFSVAFKRDIPQEKGNH